MTLESRTCDKSQTVRSRLLVSVRSVEEAEAALQGGADLIDVKEPSRGSLGRADNVVIRSVIERVADKKPVSAALGELIEFSPNSSQTIDLSGLSYAKWGLVRCGSLAYYATLLENAASLLPMNCRPVAVAYADWKRAESPSPENVCELARIRRCGAFLLDTWRKDGKTLLDWLSLNSIKNMAKKCAAAGIPIALAGSLDLMEIERLLPVAPNWFAVRGAVCRNGMRNEGIDSNLVRAIAELLIRTVQN